MFKTRFISMLVLLCLTVTSAWAQEVTLLTTINSTSPNDSFTSGSKTFDNIATVSFSGEVINDGDFWGWYSYDGAKLTVTPAEGYTITRVKFYSSYEESAFDESAPFEATLGNSEVEVNNSSIGNFGVTKIEVYGYAGTPEPATVAVTGVTLAPTSATLTLGETETVTLIPTVLPADATDKSMTWSSSNEAVATVTNGVVTAVAAGTATITVTTTDGAKTATCAVTVAAPAASTYTVTLKEGTEDANKWEIAPAEATTTGVAAGTTVTATYSGTKKVKSVKAVKKAAAPAYTLLSAATTSDQGKVVCAAGHLHDAKTAVPTGCTAVGILGKVTETGHGLILALANATSQTWNTINGWNSVTTYAGTTLKQLPDDAARGSLTSYTTLGSTTVSDWCVAQKSDYEAIFINLGSTTGDSDGTTYDANVNAYITTGVGGTAISGYYWSADGWVFDSDYWEGGGKGYGGSLRPVLGF